MSQPLLWMSPATSPGWSMIWVSAGLPTINSPSVRDVRICPARGSGRCRVGISDRIYRIYWMGCFARTRPGTERSELLFPILSILFILSKFLSSRPGKGPVGISDRIYCHPDPIRYPADVGPGSVGQGDCPEKRFVDEHGLRTQKAHYGKDWGIQPREPG